MNSSKKPWLVPSRDDPRNAWCARISGVLATIELSYLFVMDLLTPMDGARRVNADSPYFVLWVYIATIIGVSLILLNIGIRGMLSGTKSSFGSIALVITNAILLAGFIWRLIDAATLESRMP